MHTRNTCKCWRNQRRSEKICTWLLIAVPDSCPQFDIYANAGKRFLIEATAIPCLGNCVRPAYVCLSVWEVCVLVWVRMCVSQDLAPGQGKVWHFSAGHASVEQKVLINLFCPTFALSRRRCLFAWQRLNKCFCPDHKWFICYLCVPCWTSDGSLLGRHNQSSQTTLFNVKVNTLSQALTALGGYTHEKRNSGIKRITAC